MASATAAAFDNRNPYPGPRSFSRDERGVFRGRDYESRELFSLVVAHKIVLLYSQSGAGKSSLLNAGLAPLLQEEGFQVFPVARVAGRIPDSVAVEDVSNPYTLNVLLSWSEKGGDVKPGELAAVSLHEFLKRSQPAHNGDHRQSVRVLLFDQFEELFTFYPERWKERAEFIGQLAEALGADDYLRVVIGMREEYLGPLQVHAHILPESLETRFRLERLGEDDALAAVIEPLNTTRRRFAPDVAEKLVEDLLKIKVATDHTTTREVTGEYVEPVQLQVVCSGLWDKLPANTHEISLEYLQDFGDVTEALSVFYEESLKEAAQKACLNEGKLRKWFEQTLITPAGTRGTVFRGGTETGGLPNTAVDVLDAKHIIRCDSRAGSAWYELTHDRFIEPIFKSNRRWREAHGAVDRLRRELEERAEKWDEAGRPAEELLNEEKLNEAQRWLTDPKAAELGCSDKVVALIAASGAEAQRRQERRRQIEEQARNATRLRALAAVLGVAFLAAIGAAGLAWKETKAATRAKIIADLKTEEANQKENAAQKAAEALRIQALRVRQDNLRVIENEIPLLDDLIGKSSALEAAQWHLQKSSLLIQEGKLENAANEASAAIKIAPSYSDALTNRGYVSILQDRPEKALRDFGYIRDNIDPKSTLNYLNLTIAFAQLGRRADASRSLDQAIFYSSHGQNYGGAEEIVPAEITEATGRSALYANGEIFRQALYFFKPLLDACWGQDSFSSDLQAADEHARRDGIRLSEKEDAGLTALTWAWLVERKNKSDYGLSAGQGKLWEEAGYPGYASRHFDVFLKTHAERKEAKYENLAAWVRNQKTEEGREFSFAKEDPAYLEAEAELRRTQGKYAEAEELVNKAITLEPNNVRLYFDRVNILYGKASETGKAGGDKGKEEERRLYRQVISDCDRVLRLQEAPDAYYLRGMAKDFLGNHRDAIRDLKLAVELAPAYPEAIENLGNLMVKTSPEHPERAAEWFRKYDRIFPGTNSDLLGKLATLQIEMKQFADAYDTIQQAITLEPANYSYYNTRAEAEKGLGYSETQIQRDRRIGDRVAAEFLRRRNQETDTDTASNWEQDQWKLYSKMGDKGASEEVRCNSDVTTCLTLRVSHEHGENAFMKIMSLQAANGERPIVTIDRGANDGVVMGSAGTVYSPPSDDHGHVRPAATLGSAEVLSIEPQSALLRVKLSNPKGDGMVRIGDAVQLATRTPAIEQRSKLWSAVNCSIAFVDLRGQKIVDFRTLYKDESPELDQALYQKLLDDIHETGSLYGEEIGGKSISVGRFADHPMKLRQVLETTSREDLDRFFQYVVSAKASYFGHDWQIGPTYASWVTVGMPEN